MTISMVAQIQAKVPVHTQHCFCTIRGNKKKKSQYYHERKKEYKKKRELEDVLDTIESWKTDQGKEEKRQ